MAKSMKTLMITKRIKNIVHSNLSKSESFNIENLFDYNFEGVDDIRKVIDKIPLISLFTEMNELNKPYKCILFKSNKAWISEDTMNRQRYFTKNRKGDVYSFDLIDILEFYYNEPINNVFTILNDMFSIEYQIKWKNEHEYKYYYNFDAMLGLKMEDKYKNLRQIIGKFIPELHKINEFGRDNIKNKKFCHKKENIFFFSNTYLLRQSQYKSKSTINKIINLFCFLGLLEKSHTID